MWRDNQTQRLDIYINNPQTRDSLDHSGNESESENESLSVYVHKKNVLTLAVVLNKMNLKP
jgi:hypothetical protein